MTMAIGKMIIYWQMKLRTQYAPINFAAGSMSFQVVPAHFRWLKLVPGGSRWVQLYPRFGIYRLKNMTLSVMPLKKKMFQIILFQISSINNIIKFTTP